MGAVLALDMSATDEWSTFSDQDFLAAFGGSAGDETFFAEEAAKYDFSYRRLTREERDGAILSVLKRLDGFTEVGAHRHGIWTDSWEETRQRYVKSGGDIEALDPPFMGATPIVRLRGDYAIPKDPAFEHHWFRVFRHWIFKKFLGEQGPSRVFEFGCGSGFNLATIAQFFPDKELVGLDWAQPAVDLVDHVAKDHGFSLSGRRFDFFNIDKSIDVGPSAAVTTFCALEQTGERFSEFFNWLMEAKPGLVISMEPSVENYDQDDLHDYLAWRYHTHRKYLDGYFAAVRDAASQGKAEILWDRRPKFGSFYHEGYSLLIWRPT